jgi:predicted Zn-dependent protease with MMP-like domain
MRQDNEEVIEAQATGGMTMGSGDTVAGYPEADENGADDVKDLDEKSFEALEDTVDRLNAEEQQAQVIAQPDPGPDAPLRTESDFELAVRAAIDELPEQFQQALDDVVITVSDDGAKEHAYGMYVPGSRKDEGYRWWFFAMNRSVLPPQILIYRDTLERDFGSDPVRLREQIKKTVRHEVAHSLGFDEPGVRGLGL